MLGPVSLWWVWAILGSPLAFPGFPSSITIPKYLIFSLQNSHFLGFKNKSCSQSHFNTHFVACSKASLSLVKMRMLSIYTMIIPSSIRSENASSIITWKVTGELHMPKNITVGSKSPLLVLKATFHSSPLLILTLLYPQCTSNFVKYFAPFSLFMILEIRGSG